MGTEITYLARFIAPNVVWVSLLLYLITHPAVAEKWGAIFSRLFSHISKTAERHSVALDIQGRIDSFSKSLNVEVPEILPYGAKIEWVIGTFTKESFFKENKVIIRIEYHTNQDDNIAHATLEYIAKGLLLDTKPHMHETIAKSMDLISTKKLLEKERRTALPYYYGEVLDPMMDSDEELSRYVRIMNSLDEKGYFSRIFLREMQALGIKRRFSLPEQSTRDETKEFADFLDEKVARKPPGVDVDPTFISDSIALSIVYVAKGEWIGPHLKWIKKCMKKNIEKIYICARGPWNIHLVRMLRKRLRSSKRLNEVFCNEFSTPYLKSRKVDAICICYDIVSKEE